MRIIQVLSNFWKNFNTSIYLRYHIQRLKKLKKTFKKTNAKKASGLDKIPAKLVKLAAGVPAAPLYKIINNYHLLERRRERQRQRQRQSVLKMFPRPAFLCSKDELVWLLHSPVNFIYIYIYIYMCVYMYCVHFLPFV